MRRALVCLLLLVLGGMLSLLPPAVLVLAQVTAIPRGGIHLSDSCASEVVTTLLCWEGPGTPVYCGELFYEPCASPGLGLQNSTDIGNTITNATPDHPVIIGLEGYGTKYLGTDQTTGPFDWCVDGAGVRCTWSEVVVEDSPKYKLHQTAAGLFVCETTNPTTLAITYANYQSCMPASYATVPIDSTDGTQCAAVELAEIRAGNGQHYWARCNDNDNGFLYFVVDPPDNWYTDGTVQVSGRVINVAATADGNLLMGVRLQCVRSGSDTIPSSYTSTEAPTNTVTFSTQYRSERWVATVTPGGTCNSTARLFGRIEIDASGTTSNDMGATANVYLAAEAEVKVLIATRP